LFVFTAFFLSLILFYTFSSSFLLPFSFHFSLILFLFFFLLLIFFGPFVMQIHNYQYYCVVRRKYLTLNSWVD